MRDSSPTPPPASPPTQRSLSRSRTLGIASSPGEDGPAFAARVRLAAQERADEQRDAVRAKYKKRLDALQEKVARLDRERAELSSKARSEKMEAALGAGATL